jgi:cytochrome c peroxidase
MKKIIGFGIALPLFSVLVFWSCGSETAETIKNDIFSTTPYVIPEVPYFPKKLNIPIDNPMTVEGVELGRYLFYDGRLSGNSDKTKLMSCATCHIQKNGFEVGIDHPKFTDGKTYGLAHDGSKGKETPNYMLPIVNTVYNQSGYFWNGFINESNSYKGSDKVPAEDVFHYRNIESVVWMSITAEHEMNSTIEKSVAAIDAIPMYKEKFKAAFGTEDVTYDRISKAIAQFVRSIVSHDSKFHKYLRKEAELTTLEKRGHDLFFSEDADCFHCHGGSVLMTTNEYFNNAKDTFFDPHERDRNSVTGDPMDVGAYRAPSLINIELTAPYMHDGRFKSLDEIIDFYSEGLLYSDYVHPLMKNVRQSGVQLNDSDKSALKAFLLTLTDHEMVKNPQYSCPPELKEWSGQ